MKIEIIKMQELLKNMNTENYVSKSSEIMKILFLLRQQINMIDRQKGGNGGGPAHN